MTVRAVRTPLAVALDVIWGYALAALVVAAFSKGEGAGPSLAAVIAVVGGSFALSRGLSELDLDETSMRRVGVAASVLALFAILHFEYAASAAPWDFGWLRALVTEPATAFDEHRGVFAGSAVLIGLWVRGVSRGQQPLEYGDVLGTAMFGFAVVIIAAMVAPDTRGPEVFGALAVLYLVLGLAALSLFQAPEPDVPVTRFVSRWALGAGLLVGGAALLAVIAAAIDPSSAGALEPVFKPLAAPLDLFGRYVLGPLFAAPIWLLRHLLPSLDQPPPPDQQQTPQQPVEHDATRPLWQQIVGWVVAGGVVAALTLVLLVVLWFAYRRFAARKGKPDEVRTQVERDISLRDDLRALWGDLTGRFRRGGGARPAAAGVQRLYYDMLADAASAGLTRPASATPMQFAPPLDAHYASSVPGEVSAAFSASRYGRIDAGERATEEMRARWQAARRGTTT